MINPRNVLVNEYGSMTGRRWSRRMSRPNRRCPHKSGSRFVQRTKGTRGNASRTDNARLLADLCMGSRRRPPEQRHSRAAYKMPSGYAKKLGLGALLRLGDRHSLLLWHFHDRYFYPTEGPINEVMLTATRPSYFCRLAALISVLNKPGMITSDRQTDRGGYHTRASTRVCGWSRDRVYSLMYVLLVNARPELQANDFTYPWLAARAMLHGDEPYVDVARQATPWGGAFFYPLTAAVAVLPLAALPARLAGSLFVGLGAGLLAFFVSRQGLWRLRRSPALLPSRVRRQARARLAIGLLAEIGRHSSAVRLRPAAGGMPDRA